MIHDSSKEIRIRTIDAHTAGEPLRIILSGWPELPGDSILAKRAFAREHCELNRRALMWEPRGHADMYGALLLPSVTADGDLGVLFLHNEGYSTMCGHGIIALTKVVLERRLIQEREEGVLKIDTPAGRVVARANRTMNDGQVHVSEVTFRNVPSFLAEADQILSVPELGNVEYDLAFGGAFYAYVNAEKLGLDLKPENNQELMAAGQAFKRAFSKNRRVHHPSGDPELEFLYGTIFVGPAEGDAHSRNVCIFAEGEVDRSPTGTGVSGRVAIHHAKRELKTGEWIRIESILGTTFDARVIECDNKGPYPTVVPEVRGSAFITGEHEFIIDPKDPLKEGFFLR